MLVQCYTTLNLLRYTPSRAASLPKLVDLQQYELGTLRGGPVASVGSDGVHVAILDKTLP